jgi:hypothetical protein
MVDRDRKGTILSFVLRFRPGLDPALGAESQIKVIFTLGVEPVVEYYLAERRISSVIDEILATNPRPDVAEAAAWMKVTRKQGNVTSLQALRWQKEMLRAISNTLTSLPAQTRRVNDRGTASITLDASSYELWYSGGPEFHVDGVDPDSPFAKWADRFRSEVAARVK